MLLVIIGAGASNDSNARGTYVASEQWRPPLANALFTTPDFQALLATRPQVAAIIDRLTRISSDRTLEQVLDQIQSEANRHPARLGQLTAVRFYLRDLLAKCTREWVNSVNGLTNYHALLDQLSDWSERRGQPVTIVTFNYDLLLEIAARATLGLELRWDLNAYIANDHWAFYKPHGSIQWYRELDEEVESIVVDRTPAGVAIASVEQAIVQKASEGLRVSNRFVIGPSEPGSVYLQLYPAIAIPIESGKDFECPEDHLRHLEARLTKTHEILVVGWRATEANFLELMVKAIPVGMKFVGAAVCGDAKRSAETLERIRRAGLSGMQPRPIDAGLTTALEQNIETMLL